MANTHHHSLAFNVAATAALTAASILIPTAANAAVSYQTASAAVATPVLSASIQIGQLGENTYFVCPRGLGVSQILKVKSADLPVKDTVNFAVIGTSINGKLTIPDAAEKADFQKVVDNMTVAQARAAGLNGGGSTEPVIAAQPTDLQQAQQAAAAGRAADGKVVRKDDGTIEVSVNDRVVDFQNNGSHILIRTADGALVGELQYVGVGHGANAGQNVEGGLRVARNLALSGLTNGHAQQASINPNTYTITLPSGFTINSENINNGGKSIKDPNGIIATAVAGEDLVRAKLDPGFTLPADKHLRSKTGPL